MPPLSGANGAARNGSRSTRLSLEVYALALRDRERFPGYLDGYVNDWLVALEGCTTLPGFPRERSRSLATVLVAGFRGFLLDLLASHDRVRIDGAVDLWLDLLYE